MSRRGRDPAEAALMREADRYWEPPEDQLLREENEARRREDEMAHADEIRKSRKESEDE